MITISLCLIVKDEQDTIGRCLASVSDLVEEIIIVDTGSTDDTKAIARNYTEHIYDFEWINDFSAARNYAFAQASMDYIFWLDADDILQEPERLRLLALKSSLDSSVDSVTMNYHLAFDDHGNVTSSLRRNRLVKRSNGFRWIGAVHEYLEVSGKIINSDIAVTHSSLHHDSDRNLYIYEQRLSAGEDFTPRDLYYFANELLDHKMYDRAILFYEQFLGTEQGWIEDYISVFWYKTATETEQSPEHWGFRNLACSTWLPHLQLCVCYDRMGLHRLAYEHNEAARRYRPQDTRVLQNKAYLESILQPLRMSTTVEALNE